MITEPKIGGDTLPLNTVGELRSFVALLPNGYTLQAQIDMGGGQVMPMSIGGITAKPGRAVGFQAFVKLLDDADPADAAQPTSGAGTAQVGTSRLRLPLADGQVVVISGGGRMLAAGGINAQPGCVVMLDMSVMLTDDADGRAI
jgi:hypothetical protein